MMRATSAPSSVLVITRRGGFAGLLRPGLEAGQARPEAGLRVDQEYGRGDHLVASLHALEDRDGVFGFGAEPHLPRHEATFAERDDHARAAAVANDTIARHLQDRGVAAAA